MAVYTRKDHLKYKLKDYLTEDADEDLRKELLDYFSRISNAYDEIMKRKGVKQNFISYKAFFGFMIQKLKIPDHLIRPMFLEWYFWWNTNSFVEREWSQHHQDMLNEIKHVLDLEDGFESMDISL